MAKKLAKKSKLTMKQLAGVDWAPIKRVISKDHVVSLLQEVVRVIQSDDKKGYGRALFNILSAFRGPDYVPANFWELHNIKMGTVAKVRDAVGIRTLPLGVETSSSKEFDKTNDFLNQIYKDAGAHFGEHYAYAVVGLVELGIIKPEQIKTDEVVAADEQQ